MRRVTSLAAVVLLGFAAPSHAGWGALSPWVTTGQTTNCHHSSPTRTARLKVVTSGIWLDFGLWTWEEGIARNRSSSGTADIQILGTDFNNNPSRPDFFLPYWSIWDNVPIGADRWLLKQNTTGSGMFSGLRAQCSVKE